MTVAIVLAGGEGKRSGAAEPKQFVSVLGKPVIAYTLEVLENYAGIDAIEIVHHRDYARRIQEIISDYSISKVKWLVPGGGTFQESAANGVSFLRDKLAEDDIVMLTFAVSPMVTEGILDDAVETCKRYGNAIPTDEMIMCTCVRDADGLGTTQGILRESLGGFNGPWVFKYGIVRSLYERAAKDGILNKIEPHTTSIALHYGIKLYFSKSQTTNIKITRPEDFDMFEGLLLVQERRRRGRKIGDPL